MVRRASFVLLALVVACGGSPGGGGGTTGSGGTGGSAGAGGQGGTGGSGVACVDSVCSCDEAGIRAAISEGGGPFTFDCEGPTTVGTEAEIIIDNDVIMDGEGSLTVDGNEAHRVFSVSENVTAELRGFAVIKGRTDPEGDWRGGGILNDGALTLTQSTVSDSAAPGDGSFGGGIHNSGTLTMTHSTVSGNTAAYGGGIDNGGVLAVTNSTVSGNRAETLGGGISNDGTLTLTNSTVSGNTAALNTGGIRNLGTLAVVASTLSGNTTDDGSASIENHGTLTLTNSLVDDDCNLEVGPWASITSTGYTIESPGDTCGFDQPTDQVNVSADDLKLGPLQDNGGPTETHALLPGSAAIDVIPADICEVDEDQRGEPRPGSTMCDVGAFEVQP